MKLYTRKTASDENDQGIHSNVRGKPSGKAGGDMKSPGEWAISFVFHFVSTLKCVGDGGPCFYRCLPPFVSQSISLCCS